MERDPYPTISLVAGIVAFVLLLASIADGVASGRVFGAPALLLPSLVAAGLAIGFGLAAVRDPHGRAGAILGQSVAVIGLVLGLAYAAIAIVVPLLLLLLILLFGWPYANASACSCSGPHQPAREPCRNCCGGGCTAHASVGGCCDGGGGCCGGGGGCCGCSLLSVAPGAITWASRLDHLFAHHPDAPAFVADTYRVGRVRLCIGCFTTHPIFLVATSVLLVTPWEGKWWMPIAVGLVMSGTQGISSAGLAKRRAIKIAVKTSLGAGLALVVVGTLRSPLPPVAKAGALLCVLGLALASTVPRARRMRRAISTCSCAQRETSTP